MWKMWKMWRMWRFDAEAHVTQQELGHKKRLAETEKSKKVNSAAKSKHIMLELSWQFISALLRRQLLPSAVAELLLAPAASASRAATVIIVNILLLGDLWIKARKRRHSNDTQGQSDKAAKKQFSEAILQQCQIFSRLLDHSLLSHNYTAYSRFENSAASFLFNYNSVEHKVVQLQQLAHKDEGKVGNVMVTYWWRFWKEQIMVLASILIVITRKMLWK